MKTTPVNVFTLIEQQILAAPAVHDRAVAFHLCNELRMIDCGHVADITIPDGETVKPLATLREIGGKLPLELGSVRVRALRMIDQLHAIAATLLPDL